MPLRENFLYTLKAGPAGGLRPPSGPAATRRSPGSPPHRSLTLDRQGQRSEHVVLVRPPTDERRELNTLYSQEMSTISVVTNHAIRHSCASRTNTKADQVQAGPPVRLGLVSGTPAGCQREGGPLAPTTHRRTVTVILCAVALAALSGCGGRGDTTTSTPTTSTTPAASAGGQTYSRKAFVVPLTVTVDAALKSPPNPDSPHLLSCYAAVSDVDNAVRFFVPVIIYPLGSDTPQAPPKDYLQCLTKAGAEFSKATKITVDGHPATLMNLTTSRPEGYLSGLIGCSDRTA